MEMGMELGSVWSDLNWLGAVIGAVVAYLLGMVWYHQSALGAVRMKASSGGKPSSPGAAMTAQAVYTLVLAILIALLESLSGGITLYGAAVLLLAAAALTGMLAGTLFQGQSITGWAVDAGYEALSIFIIALAVVWI